MRVEYKQQIPFSTMRHALLVMAFCSLPQLAFTPWWFSVLVLIAIGYGLWASYYNTRILSVWSTALVVVLVLILLRLHYQTFFSSGFFIGALVTFFWLKIIESYSIRDLRFVVLVGFFVIFTALIIFTQLWIIVFMVIATLGLVTLLIRLESPQLQFRKINLKISKIVLIGLPVSLLMFFIFPRINQPLWGVNMPRSGQTGFSETMQPGSISGLSNDTSTAFRVTFKHAPQIDDYWKGITLNYFDGSTWKSVGNNYFIYINFINKADADYEVIMEPHDKTWLFYTDHPYAGWPKLRFSSSMGLIKEDNKPINKRFAYALSVTKPPYKPLNPVTFAQNTQLPLDSNPRAQQWAVQTFAMNHHSIPSFINAIRDHIQKNPFWYKLEPKSVGNTDQIDTFWFTTQEGYCEHYAGAVAFILRAAKIPTRVVLGYHGGEWNPIANYLNVAQKDAHAWLEYWVKDLGWQRLDPTSFILPSRIDDTIREQSSHEQELGSNWESYRLQMPWMEHLRLSTESAKFLLERWLLFYNAEEQRNLLKKLGFKELLPGNIFLLWLAVFFIFLFAIGLWYMIRQKKEEDPLAREYRKFLKELAYHNISTHPPTSLLKQGRQLILKYPQHAALFKRYLQEYEDLRLRYSHSDHHKKASTRILLKNFRKNLRKYR